MLATLAQLLDEMQAQADARGWKAYDWAARAQVRPETLSRLRRRGNCDLRTLRRLAGVLGLTLRLANAADDAGTLLPGRYDRDFEERLLELAASRNTDPARWRETGPGFFMGGFAVMLSSDPHFDRSAYLGLGDRLHPGISSPEAFGVWLALTPLRPYRFMPMLNERMRHAAQPSRA